jgi:geranylgeranyl pyrophosphate synthase
MFTQIEYEFHLPKVIDIIDLYTENELKEIVQYQFKNSGKGFRSLLSIHICETLGISPSKIYPLCSALELIHNASLVHDDIEDNDEYRRGDLAIWKKFGLSNAINFGDYLFATAFEILCQKSPELVEILSLSIKELVKGQIMEINSNSLQLIDYLEIAKRKTGALFILSIFAPYQLKGNADRDTIISFGYNLGEIYQLRDDIIDVIGQKEGRPQYSDIKEARFSILNIITYEDIADKEGFRAMLLNGVSKNELLELYKKNSTLEKAYNLYHKKIAELKNGSIYDDIKPVIDIFLEKLSLPMMNEKYYGF